MDVKKYTLLGFLFVLLVVLIILFFRGSGLEKIKPSPPPPAPESGELSSEPQEMRTVTLFFLSEEDSLLHPEEREIPSTSSLLQQIKLLVEELLKGPQDNLISPFPPETKLRELFLTEEGIAYLDLSREMQENHPSGSSAEIFTVFSLVNSLTFNFKSVKKVFILIDGDEKETLAGHIDLSRPLLPRYDLIAQ